MKLGLVTLNISFGIYLILYLPQILHNRKSNHIAHLSLGMHYLLYLAYIFDLYYGFAKHLQWQYKIVSIVGFSLVTLQHLQITHFFYAKNKKFAYFNQLFLVLVFIALYHWFLKLETVPESFILLVGLMSRIGFVLYSLPQIIKNQIVKHSKAINIKFIYLNLTLAILDMISAWCLDWGWPNKLAAPFTISCMLILLMQKCRL